MFMSNVWVKSPLSRIGFMPGVKWRTPKVMEPEAPKATFVAGVWLLATTLPCAVCGEDCKVWNTIRCEPCHGACNRADTKVSVEEK